jgi:Uma2 family endonuclease
MAVKTVPPQPRLITVEEYEQMVQAGVFPEDDRIEMIEGQITAMSPIGSSHSGQVNRLNRLAAPRLGTQAILGIQNPIKLARSEPQPDLALLKTRGDDYAHSHPTAREVLLVVEVADTSAEYDRNVKIPLYGRSGIAEAWLIDLSAGVIEVYRQPNQSGYGEKRTYAPGDSLAPIALPDLVFTVTEILGTPA